MFSLPLPPTLSVHRDEMGCCYTVRPGGASAAGTTAAAIALACASAAIAASLVRCAILLLLLLLVAFLLRLVRVCEESLAAYEGSGVQSSSRRAFGWYSQSCFIESASIADVFIGEAVRLDRCHFYLALLLHATGSSAEPRVVVPFRHLIPRLCDLHIIHTGARASLWPDASAKVE